MLLWAPRRIFWSVRNPNQRSTWLIQDEPVGVKCMWKRGCRASQARIAGVLWVPCHHLPTGQSIHNAVDASRGQIMRDTGQRG